jgi:hypothetical protein
MHQPASHQTYAVTSLSVQRCIYILLYSDATKKTQLSDIVETGSLPCRVDDGESSVDSQSDWSKNEQSPSSVERLIVEQSGLDAKSELDVGCLVQNHGPRVIVRNVCTRVQRCVSDGDVAKALGFPL